ncbi:MAG: tRNA lysidine(34) synthetase TilS [Alphaproteobacteria bacterium]|nr:tRNA lysidine(34) synthetase TilS [Alphaproteobacteria bacterium]
MSALTLQEFTALLEPFAADISDQAVLSVAVSGGPDSMALAFLLSRWANMQCRVPIIQALIVDHGLRAESADEAAQIQETLRLWPHIQPAIMKWHHEKVENRIQEKARKARYALMAEQCAAQGSRFLFAGHHQDDQAETFLLRLAGGSGLDGLAGMRPAQVLDGITVLRPLLSIPKARLLETCRQANVPFVMDSSNEYEAFARVRVRRARAVLEREGLSSSRLCATARRMSRAREALEIVTEKSYMQMAMVNDTSRIEFDFGVFKEQPEEIAFRCLCKAIRTLGLQRDYAPRLERLEGIFSDLLHSDLFRKRTLGGVIIERPLRAEKSVKIIFRVEAPDKPVKPAKK